MHLERSFTQNPAPASGNLVLAAGQTVIELRSRRGWTQEKLADKSILSVRTIQNLERGKVTHLATIAKVAEALGVAPRDCIASVAASASPETGTGVPDCPYRGLLAFREDDVEVFFGRELLIELLREKLAYKNIIQVSGYSGSGKSSLISAGLIPALRRAGAWNVLYCRPGSDPFGALASVLMPQLEPRSDEITRAAQLPRLHEVLQQGQLSYLLTQIFRNSNADGLLLFIDQFEELYTQCHGQHVRDRFLDALVPVASAGPALKLVFTIRADFTSRLLSHRRFIDQIQESDVKIGPMTRNELESVIQEPASRQHVKFEEGLAERILTDVGAEPGTLPLLEFALTELWGHQNQRTLTHSAYERIGQLSGAIAHRAEKVYRSLSALEQEAARHILTRLVRLADEGGEDTRQRIPFSALYSEDLLNTDSGRRVLAVLAEARLVTVGLESSGRQEMVEIAHEALVRRWPRLSQWLQEDREILIWRQRLRLIIREWAQTGRDDGFLLRGPLLDEARVWLSRRANDLTPEEKDFISSSLALWHRERSRRAIACLELLVDNTGSEQAAGEGEYARAKTDLQFLRRPGTLRLQINVMSVPEGHVQAMRSRFPTLPLTALGPLFSSAVPVDLPDDDDPDLPRGLKPGQKLDDQTFALVRDLQSRGASGLALELLNPQLDGISDPNVRLKFASIVFDMMHVRGRYADAAELIRQELALHPLNADEHLPTLLSLRIRLVHHQMFYRPVPELWQEMLDLLGCVDCGRDPESYGEILYMLGGNLGTLKGDYREARSYLVRCARHARRRKDFYLLTRCLRKYGDFLRFQGHLQPAQMALMEALRISARGRGTRQRIYVLGCLGDLERQKRNYSSATEYFERAIELGRSTFIPGWLGNLYLGLAEIAIDQRSFEQAKILLDQAEAHYRNTHPRHWWGDIQVALGRCRLMRNAGDPAWAESARRIQAEATTAGYSRDAGLAASVLSGVDPPQNVLMFL